MHEELSRLAHYYMSGERVGHTLQTTALVNEAYLRLVDVGKVHWQNRAHFFAVWPKLEAYPGRFCLLTKLSETRRRHSTGVIGGRDGDL